MTKDKIIKANAEHDKKEAKRLTKRIESIRLTLSFDVGSSTMDLINDLVNAEVELEALCNQ